MVLLNISVYDTCCRRDVLTWSILQCSDERLSITNFFKQVVLDKVECDTSSHILEEVRVGQSKDVMDIVGDTSVLIVDVVNSFGRYVKFYLTKVFSPSPPPQQLQTNAFDVLMAAQRRLDSVHLPPLLIVRNKRDQLYNDILSTIESMKFQWKSNEVHGGTATKTIQALRDALWYVDGAHETLAERACRVPEVFKKFTNYNRPDLSKHRKRSAVSLSRDVLLALSQSLFQVLQYTFWNRAQWKGFKSDVELLARCLASYADHLLTKARKIGTLHDSEEVVRSVGDGLSVRYTRVRHSPPSYLTPVTEAVTEAGPNSPVELGDLLPNDRRRRYEWLMDVRQGLQVPLIHMTYSPGSNLGNLTWIWHCTATDIDSALQNSQPIIEELKKCIPQFHTRAMRRAAYEKFGLVTPSTKKSVLRHLYKDFVHDSSASSNLSEAEVDERVAALFELEEPSLVYDLRDHYGGKQSKFEVFWQAAKEYLEEDVGTAVDDRRHSTLVHIAKAISIRDLREKVAEKCPPGTITPSDEWIRLQFSPMSLSSCTALRYTGRLQVRHKVQQRQWRKQHEDSHYAACIFRYEREYAVRMREFAIFACLDDKHKIKIGEPDFPVASAERGRQVIVASNSQLVAGDHDFTKFSIVPSVVLLTEIPSEISGSWYDGQVLVSFKEGTFEPSSPTRHTTELMHIVENKAVDKPVLFLYSDGGPDHRLTFLSVKLSLIALFLKLDLDYLCAARTAPYHSYCNPVERIMSVLNLGLQAVALARAKMIEEMETEVAKCNSMKALRVVAQRKTNLADAVSDSIAPSKILLSDIARRLELKNKKFQVFTAASASEMDEFWTALLSLDENFQLNHSDKVSAKDLTPPLVQFFTHCCRERHYFFEILKCGEQDCTVCKPPRLPLLKFSKLGHLPDPIPGDDSHYKAFDTVFKTNTSEEHRPSAKKSKGKSLPFRASVQHVKNTEMMLQCDECSMWRLVYSKKKLTSQEKLQLERSLDNMTFSCGANLQDADIPPQIKEHVCVRNLSCGEPIEKLYYAAKFTDICIYCGSLVHPWNDTEQFYPQCESCASRTPIENEKEKERK